jgi:hypothetical protein
MTPFDQLRINQLASPYSPDVAPSLPLDFGDYLSIIWLLDRAAHIGNGVSYYRKCERALATALGLIDTRFGHLIKTTEAGKIGETIPNLAYRGSERRVDAADRRNAIDQLLTIRSDVLRLGSYSQGWDVSWPGSRIIDEELRERIFAVLFAALPSQWDSFARILLVLDIVLQELLIGSRRGESYLLHTLVTDYGWPAPEARDTIALFRQN